MNYREERDKIERDRMALRVWQSEFRPEVVRKLEAKEAQPNISETASEQKEFEAYNSGRLKHLLNPKFHVIAKLTILPSENIFSQYIATLETANALAEDMRRNPGEDIWAKLFGGRKKELVKLDKTLEDMKSKAQLTVNEFIELLS